MYLFSFTKSFWKKIKTMKGQGEKQIKALQDHGQVKTIKNILIIMKILHWSQNKKKYLMDL